jgi:hypothetical protein
MRIYGAGVSAVVSRIQLIEPEVVEEFNNLSNIRLNSTV